MAVIGKIRQRSGLLIFIIGASIVGFLIMDATNSQYSVLRGGRKDSIGKVNGEKISNNDFTKKYEENIKSTEDQMQGQSLTDQMKDELRTQTWNEMVNDLIFDKVYASLGINVTPEEMNELATGERENISPAIIRAFGDPRTGQYDPNRFRDFLRTLDNDQEGTEPGTRRKAWLRFETALKQGEFQEKYSTLISKGLYVPSWMGEMTYNDQNRLVDFKYVQLPYSTVNDADVKVTDADLKKYLDEHAGLFKQDEETRKFDYVTFDIVPSHLDTVKTGQFLEDKRADFAAGKTPSDDSVFVKLYSETPFDDSYYEKSKVISPVTDSLFTLKVGSIVGPYIDGGAYKMAKISDRKMISDSVHLREITISFAGINPQDPQAQSQANGLFKLADSVYRAIDSLHADFAKLAVAYSSDPASKMKGGDLGWVKQGEKDKAYNNLIFFHGQKGKVYKIPVQADNAIHIVQIVDDKPTKPAVLVSYLTKEIVPSDETTKSIFNNATNFASDNQSEAKFKSAGEKLSIKTVNAVKNDAFEVEGLGSARNLVKWVYTAKKGDVSSVLPLEKRYVVALLEQVRPKGLPDVDAVRNVLTAAVVKEKKFDLLAKKITDAGAANIDDLGTKFSKTVSTAEKASLGNASLQGAFEPAVVATALASPAGKLSKPVKGTSGVYVVQTISVQEPVKTTDYSIYTMQLKQQLQNKARLAADVEKKLAKVEDNRFDFF